MSIWFEGSIEVACTLQQVEDSFDDLGAHYVGVVSRMPGLSTVVLVEQGDDFVIIRTNEGLMKRTGFVKSISETSITVEFGEEYQAGSRVTGTAHFLETFTARGPGIEHRTVVSDVDASGILGFLYRTFGKKSMGRAFLGANKAYLEDYAAQGGG